MAAIKGIVHSVSGRLRLLLEPLNLRKDEVEAVIRKTPGVISVTFSNVSNTAIVYYDESNEVKYILQAIDSLLYPFSNKRNKKKKENLVEFKNQMRNASLVFASFIIEKMGVGSPFVTQPFSYLTPTALTTLYACKNIIFSGVKSIFHPNPDTLSTVAIVASILKGSPNSALIIYLMSAVSEGLSEYTMNRTRTFVSEMMKLDATYAWLMNESGQQSRVKTSEVEVGDKVIVFHGEKIPFDGTVTELAAHVDQSSITGEYMPITTKAGTFVYAGGIVVEGKVILQVERVGKDLTINRMIRLIEEAQDKQANIQMLSERFTNAIAPISLAGAAVLYLCTGDWNKVLNMLVIDYVCGVKLSTATAISATIGKCAKNGVLLKGGQTIESLSKVDTVILDKTGTITEGEPIVTKVIPLNGWKEEDVLAYALSAEEHSSHPIAQAIRKKASEKGVKNYEHDDESIVNVVGKGMEVTIEGETVLVGSLSFMREKNVVISTEINNGIFVAKEKRLMGIFIIEDKIRYGINKMINRLRNQGVKEIIMLTGDYESSARNIADSLLLDKYISEALPEDKVAIVKHLKEKENRVIMMVGDGINDAPSLAYADIGVTMGAKKTDIAMETADVVIHSENPLLIADCLYSSKKAMSTIKQNLFATMTINTGAILLGIFGVIKPVTGAAIHNTSTLALVLNSARLLITGEMQNGKKYCNAPFNAGKNPFADFNCYRNQ